MEYYSAIKRKKYYIIQATSWADLKCSDLNVCVFSNLYVEILIPKVIVLEIRSLCEVIRCPYKRRQSSLVSSPGENNEKTALYELRTSHQTPNLKAP